MKTCENCGCKIAEYGCVNCNEELYILDQYCDEEIQLPNDDSKFMKKVKQINHENPTNRL